MAILKNIKYKIASLFLLFKVQGEANAQLTASIFEPEINYFRQVDMANKIPAHPILFIGSSSIKNWVKIDSAFEGYNVLNRGFGGSTLPDVINYAGDVILKYDPKQIVIYCGENDFANTDTISPKTVFNRFMKLYNVIRDQYPEVPIVYISLKPSPAKTNMMQKIMLYNNMVAIFSLKEKNLTYADVYSKMMAADGKPDSSLFYADKTHMNAKGYDVWNAVVRPMLIN